MTAASPRPSLGQVESPLGTEMNSFIGVSFQPGDDRRGAKETPDGRNRARPRRGSPVSRPLFPGRPVTVIKGRRWKPRSTTFPIDRPLSISAWHAAVGHFRLPRSVRAVLRRRPLSTSAATSFRSSPASPCLRCQHGARELSSQCNDSSALHEADVPALGSSITASCPCAAAPPRGRDSAGRSGSSWLRGPRRPVQVFQLRQEWPGVIDDVVRARSRHH